MLRSLYLPFRTSDLLRAVSVLFLSSHPANLQPSWVRVSLLSVTQTLNSILYRMSLCLDADRPEQCQEEL